MGNREFNHVLKKLNTKINQHKILSFDVETCDNNQTFLVCDVYDGFTHKTFFNKQDVVNYLIFTRHPNTYICATNLQFDFTTLIPKEQLYKFNIISRGSKFIMCSYSFATDIEDKHDSHANKFIDSLNHYLGSVESAGKILNIPKLETPCYIGLMPDRNKKATVWIDKERKKFKTLDIDEWEYLIIYNQRDTEVTYKLMEFFQKSYNELGCEMKITIASTALNLWRRQFLPETLYKESFVLEDDSINKLIFDSYYGGRTECFARGYIKADNNTSIKIFDINSLYPACMCEAYPLPQSVVKPDNFTESNIFNYMGVSEVTISIDYLHYPLLPYRDVVTKKLLFPIGTWRGTYTHLELKKAIQLGYKIEKIHNQIIYTKSFYPFRDYVITLYNLRQHYKSIKSPLEITVKLLMNSLYGKLAQKSFNEIKWFNLSEMSKEEWEEWLNSTDTETFDNVGFSRTKKDSDSNFIYPILASYVTSYGRLKIYDYLTKYNGLYCDTDSIITFMDIPNSNELGEMKLENELKELIIIKPKMYMKKDLFDKEFVKLKGIPNPDINILTKVLNNEKIFYNKFTKVSESIRLGFDVNSIREVSKLVKLEDNKRVWFKPFDKNSFDNNSKPHLVNHVELHKPHFIHRLNNRERLLKSQNYYNKIKSDRVNEFINSDLFDKASVGRDINYEEFIQTEIFYDRFT